MPAAGAGEGARAGSVERIGTRYTRVQSLVFTLAAEPMFRQLGTLFSARRQALLHASRLIHPIPLP